MRWTRSPIVARSVWTLSVSFVVGVCLISVVFLSQVSPAADDPKKAADDPKKSATDEPKKSSTAIKIGQNRDAETEGELPKYTDLKLPTAEEFLRSKPFDWIALKNQEAIVVEPVGPRPDTLVKLNADYERYLLGSAGMIEGETRLKEKRLQFRRVEITLFEPGEGQDPDYVLDTKLIQKIDYFEDLILRRTNLLIDEGKISLAYDLLMLVDRRNRENNVRMTEAYETRKKEEASARTDEERFRFKVPELFPLQLLKAWPKFDETYQRLLYADAEQHAARGQLEPAMRLFVNLWEHNSSYPDLSEGLGRVIDRMVVGFTDKGQFRDARHFLGRLASLDAQHPIFLKWKTELTNRTTALMGEARAESTQGHGDEATRLIELAARVWPDTAGLKDTHRELIDRFQSLRLGVLRLADEPTKYPFELPADMDAIALTALPLFEPTKFDERGVRYRSPLFDTWEPGDLGRQVQFTLRLKRADWEARPLMTSTDILDELSRRIDPSQPGHDERLAGIVERLTVQSPSQFTIHFRRLPLRLESFLEFPISLSEESISLNSDISAGALPTAGRERFYKHQQDEHQISYRRVRPQPSTAKTRHVDEVIHVRYDSWERALQGMLRGEVMGVTRVGLNDLKQVQDDSRFLVVPFALPASHFILFNPRCVALRDGQLRRALSLALNREQLIRDSILNGLTEPLARPASSPFPTSSYGHNRVLAEPMFDPQRAAVLALTAKKQMGEDIPVLRLTCPPDPAIQAAAIEMIEAWRRVGITVRLVDNSIDSADQPDDWDMVYRITRIVEPLTEFWPLLTLQPDATVESLKPLPERMRRQLLELDRSIDWTSATKLIHRIETELLVEARYLPLWEVDEFFVTRRQLMGLPPKLMNAFQDVERWTLQSWYPTEVP
jgi:hypothetical protein